MVDHVVIGMVVGAACSIAGFVVGALTASFTRNK